MTIGEGDFKKSYDQEYSEGLYNQRRILELLLNCERFISMTENALLPDNTIYFEVSSDIARKIKDK